MRLVLSSVNRELQRLGHNVELAKGKGYFYFHSGEAANWIDPGVRVRKLNDLTLKQWVEQFRRSRELNRQLMQATGIDGE